MRAGVQLTNVAGVHRLVTKERMGISVVIVLPKSSPRRMQVVQKAAKSCIVNRSKWNASCTMFGGGVGRPGGAPTLSPRCCWGNR
jgi:hypothetical protein